MLKYLKNLLLVIVFDPKPLEEKPPLEDSPWETGKRRDAVILLGVYIAFSILGGRL